MSNRCVQRNVIDIIKDKRDNILVLLSFFMLDIGHDLTDLVLMVTAR